MNAAAALAWEAEAKVKQKREAACKKGRRLKNPPLLFFQPYGKMHFATAQYTGL